MKNHLTYSDLLALEDLQSDRIADLRHRHEEFGHEIGHLIEQAEGTLKRLRAAIRDHDG